MYQIATPQFRSLLESVSPVVAWDFTLGGYPLPVSVTAYSRTSNATLTDSTGKITYAGNNLLLNTSNIGGTSWTTQANATVTTNNASAPDGSVTASKAVISGVAGTNAVYQTYTAVSGVTYIASVYAKAAGSRYLYIQNNRGDGTFALAQADLNTGVIVYSTNVVTASVAVDGNGYYRVSMVFATTGAAGSMAFVGSNTVVASSNPSVSGNGTDGVYLWGGQFEAVTYQTTPSAYKPTTSAAYYESPRTLWVNGVASGNLLEGAATNNLLYANKFDTVPWGAGGTPTLTANAGTSPDGTNNAWQISRTSGTAGVYQFSTTSASTTYTSSIYVKISAVSAGAKMRIGNDTGLQYSDFDLNALTVANTGTSVGSIQTAPNGWYRFSITYQPGAGSTGLVFYIVNGNATLLIYGAQQELGVVATTLIPTYAASLTRAADTPSAVSSPLGANLSFSRSSNATIFDATGALTYAGNNLATWSTDLANAAWSKTNIAVYGPANDYQLLARTSTAAAAYLQQTNLLPSNTSGMISVRVKAGTVGTLVGIRIQWTYPNRVDLVADLSNGTVTYAAATSNAVLLGSGIVSLGNGEYQIYIAGKVPPSDSALGVFVMGPALNSGNAWESTSGTFLNAYFKNPRLSAITYETTPRAVDDASTLASAYYGPALDYNTSGVAQGLRIEEARTNSIRNSTMQGAVAGSPGTLPTNWSVSGLGTLTQTIALGTEYGMPYLDVRLNGTTSTTAFNINFESTTQIAAANGQTWTGSVYARLVGGSLTNITSTVLQVNERNNAGSSLAGTGTTFTATSSLSRTVVTRVFNQATTAFTSDFIIINFSSGVAIDITLRIYMPQLEGTAAAFATSPIPTYGSALTRAADDARVMASGLSAGIPQSASVVFEFVQEGLMSSGSFPWVLSVNDNTTNNEIGVYQTGGTTNFNLKERTSASNQFDNTYYTSVAANTTYRLALKWTPSLVTAYMNGGNRASYAGTPPASASLTQIELLSELSSSGRSSGYVRGVSFYNQALSDAQMAVKSVVGSPL